MTDINDIAKLLDDQGIKYEFLSNDELNDIDKKWKSKFIGKRSVPYLEKYRWHIFSYHSDKLEGEQATVEYKKQHPTNIYIFNEGLQKGIKCKIIEKLPDIELEEVFDDLYICHHNMKWTYVITHESPDFGPYFSL